MTEETKHLLKWQAEWLKRFITTWCHIIYRPAYRKYLLNKQYKSYDSKNTDSPEWIG